MRYLVFIAVLLFSFNADAFEIRIEDKAVYDVAKADTPEKLEKGLMFVKDLPQNKGMWFDLRNYVKPAMWMKDTYISLDMLFVGCDFKIVDIYQNAEPFSLEKISSEQDFCYVIEINGGESAKHNLQIGDKVLIVVHHKTMLN